MARLQFCIRCGDSLRDAAEQPSGAVFHDIVRGGNLLYSTGPGWDYSTGLGTPRVAPLARAIIDLLKR